MARLRETAGEYAKGAYTFKCPGCDLMHIVHTVPNQPAGNGNTVWSFNGNVDLPTFHPSLLVTAEWGEERKKIVCHSFIVDGNIQFLNDCTHKLAGQTVPLSEI